MNQFTVDDLKEILRSSAGDTEEADLDGDIGGVSFDELGYDSLALLEVCRQVETRYGVELSGDAVAEMPTPAEAVEYINDVLAKARI
ncbi:acyl carrier protein [Amycolatopsis sp. NPDC059027]|uniref:acyl carrier protein n=1 Tax=unclassified Amycolatopsis TaxID=2618356 RepID=UPI0036701639